MKKFFFYGIAVQIIIAFTSYVTDNLEIIGNADVLIVFGVLSLGAAMNQGGGGWEFVGLKDNEKKKVFSLQATRNNKMTLFILPAIIVLMIYFWFNGFNIGFPGSPSA